MVRHHPLGVVQWSHDAVGGELEVIKTTVHAASTIEPGLFDGGNAQIRERVLGKASERIHERLEVRLADERRGVARVVQVLGHRRCVDGERHAIHPRAVRRRELTRQHRGPRRHADH